MNRHEDDNPIWGSVLIGIVVLLAVFLIIAIMGAIYEHDKRRAAAKCDPGYEAVGIGRGIYCLRKASN